MAGSPEVELRGLVTGKRLGKGPLWLVVPQEGHTPVEGRKILIKPLKRIAPAAFLVEIRPPRGPRKGIGAVLKDGKVGEVEPEFLSLIFPRTLVAVGPREKSYEISKPMLQLYQPPPTSSKDMEELGKHLAALAALSWHTGYLIHDLLRSNLRRSVIDIFSLPPSEPVHDLIYLTLADIKKVPRRLARDVLVDGEKLSILKNIFRDHFSSFASDIDKLYAYIRGERQKLYSDLKGLGYKVRDEWERMVNL